MAAHAGRAAAAADDPARDDSFRNHSIGRDRARHGEGWLELGVLFKRDISPWHTSPYTAPRTICTTAAITCLLYTSQTGLAQLRIADLSRDADLLEEVRSAAAAMLASMPERVTALRRRWIGEREQYGRVG